MMSIVSMTGTLVKRESTSRDASKPVGRMVRTICKNSSVELIIYIFFPFSISDHLYLSCTLFPILFSLVAPNAKYFSTTRSVIYLNFSPHLYPYLHIVILNSLLFSHDVLNENFLTTVYFCASRFSYLI